MPDTQTQDSDADPIPLSTKQPERTGIADHDTTSVPLGDALNDAYDAVTDGESWHETFTTHVAGHPIRVGIGHDGIDNDLQLELVGSSRSVEYPLSGTHPANTIRTALSRPGDYVSVAEASPECGRETLRDLLQSEASTVAFRVEYFGFVDYFEVDLDYGGRRYAQLRLAPGEDRYRYERVRIDNSYDDADDIVMSSVMRMLSDAHSHGGTELQAYVSADA